MRSFSPGLNTRSAIVQFVSTFDGAATSGTSTMNYDDTIPQNTEGHEFRTLSIAPLSASNTLIIEVLFNISVDVSDVIIIALFQDSTADAIAVTADVQGSAQNTPTLLRHIMTAGTTGLTTFKARAGFAAGGDVVRLNGDSASAKFGGVMSSGMTITEIR